MDLSIFLRARRLQLPIQLQQKLRPKNCLGDLIWSKGLTSRKQVLVATVALVVPLARVTGKRPSADVVDVALVAQVAVVLPPVRSPFLSNLVTVYSVLSELVYSQRFGMMVPTLSP